jgi:aminopeptidase-like protein
MTLEARLNKALADLFPMNRSITGAGLRQTLGYIRENVLPDAVLKSVASGTEVFDWRVPNEWHIAGGYVKNRDGETIIDFSANNLHVMSYSSPIDQTVSKEELLRHLHTMPKHPDWIPYRTSYYDRNWGFCCAQSLVESAKFSGPFEVRIDSSHDADGRLDWLECVKQGQTDQEILISTYCCHPGLANDNLSGVVTAIFLFEYLQSLDTRFTYRLVVAPETIGAICFLSQANTANIVGGMVLSCVAGPGEYSLKEGFDNTHWINTAAHHALKSTVGDAYTVYPFVPDGSDERQYSSPGFRIVTPSIHKAKYYEFEEYHTSADNLDFISVASLVKTLEIYKYWVTCIESYCHPKRINMHCEFQLGKRGLYPKVGGAINQLANADIEGGAGKKRAEADAEINLSDDHLNAFNWLMHLADGTMSNFEIAARSGLSLTVVNESITAMHRKQLLTVL